MRFTAALLALVVLAAVAAPAAQAHTGVQGQMVQQPVALETGQNPKLGNLWVTAPGEAKVGSVFYVAMGVTMSTAGLITVTTDPDFLFSGCTPIGTHAGEAGLLSYTARQAFTMTASTCSIVIRTNAAVVGAVPPIPALWTVYHAITVVSPDQTAALNVVNSGSLGVSGTLGVTGDLGVTGSLDVSGDLNATVNGEIATTLDGAITTTVTGTTTNVQQGSTTTTLTGTVNVEGVSIESNTNNTFNVENGTFEFTEAFDFWFPILFFFGLLIWGGYSRQTLLVIVGMVGILTQFADLPWTTATGIMLAAIFAAVFWFVRTFGSRNEST